MRNLDAGIFIVLCGVFLATANPLGGANLVGTKKCTYGPSYWCSNLTNAKGCNAVRHCIQTVWETHTVPQDNDSICKICKDMVAQARDQLRSNETMDELRQVFEGSCNLIPIKVVKKECSRLADDFIPELVEALSSQMNPDQVCSVAGLCNNAEIDKLLMNYYSAALDGTLQEEEVSHEVHALSDQQKPAASIPEKQNKLSCGSCNDVATLITDKFSAANRDDVLENILRLCGEMSTFSDACSNIVLTYFNDIYEHLKQQLSSAGICHMSGVCAGKYHQHPEDLQAQKEDTNTLVGGDDIPCELCQQLVQHLRDVLIANTTESEFKLVLQGLCKQSKGFEKECLSIVEEYYDVIYHSLVENLDTSGACFLIGVCPKGSYKQQFTGEIRPLLPVFPPAEIKVTIRKKLGANEPKFTQQELQAMTLPIDTLMGAANPELLVDNGQTCTLCEYLLHYIQDTLATPKTEDDIKRTVNGICNKLPTALRGDCHNFIDMYGDAVIALLVQELDPREVCPKLQLCPKSHDNRDDVEIFAPEVEFANDDVTDEDTDKPTCPLCLFAVEQAQEKIKNDKSKSNIKNVLNHLCVHLPTKLQTECEDFVQTYSSELVDMLITDFKPQEICVALKLCPKTNSYLSDLGISLEDDAGCSSEEDCESHELDNDNEKPVEITFDKDDAVAPNCWLCEEFIKNAEKKVGKHTTKADVKKALARSCDKLRKKIQPRCKAYVDKYGDRIATLVLKEMEPKMICRELGLCLWSEQEDLEIDEALKYDVIALPNEEVKIMPTDRLTGMDDIIIQEPPSCVLCEFTMTKLEAELKNKTTQEEIKRTIETVCNHMPKTVARSCDKFIDQYANAIIALIGSVPPKEICQKLQLCLSAINDVVNDEVIECGVCHGASTSLLSYLKQHPNDVNDSMTNLIAIGCEVLPAKYFKICSEMMHIYGRSILNLGSMEYVDESHICAQIGKCYDDEKSRLAFVRISV